MKAKRGQTVFQSSAVRDSLATAVLGSEYATPRKQHKVIVRGHPPVKLDDAVVLEIRRLHEQCGLSGLALCRHLHAEHGISVPEDRVTGLCQYTTRAHLVPTEKASPYLTKGMNMQGLHQIHAANQASVVNTEMQAARAAGKFVVAIYSGLNLVSFSSASTQEQAETVLAEVEATSTVGDRHEILAPTAVAATA